MQSAQIAITVLVLALANIAMGQKQRQFNHHCQSMAHSWEIDLGFNHRHINYMPMCLMNGISLFSSDEIQVAQSVPLVTKPLKNNTLSYIELCSFCLGTLLPIQILAQFQVVLHKYLSYIRFFFWFRLYTISLITGMKGLLSLWASPVEKVWKVLSAYSFLSMALQCT